MTHNKEITYPAVSYWLLSCCFMVFIMVVIGGITRLTGSGLSIVEWKPLMGAIPPLNESAWLDVFTKYQQSPEFKHVNHDMDLSGFKQIFFWEWFHRLWGRLIGMVYFLPFVYFLHQRQIPRKYMFSFIGFFLLGAAQGLMGWYMVKSGLVDNPAVSQYRLAAHLFLAFLIFGLMLRMALRLGLAPHTKRLRYPPLRLHMIICFVSMTLTILWGAFVAGLDAGLIYNTFPLMAGGLWPSEIWHLSPFWINLFENHATVQFMHRLLAVTTAGILLSYVLRSYAFSKPKRSHWAFVSLAMATCAQVSLGIATLLTQVHTHIAVTHQAVAFILLGCLIWTAGEIRSMDIPYKKDVIK